MSSKLEFEDQLALVKEVIPRKVGPSDAQELHATLKLSLNAPAGDMLPYFHPSLRQFLFCDEGLRIPQLGEFEWDLEMKHMEFSIYGQTFQGATLKAFKIRPHLQNPPDDPDLPGFDPADFHYIELSFKCDVKIEEGRQLAIIAEMIGYEVHIALRANQKELDFEGA
jgi:hypothetical protein